MSVTAKLFQLESLDSEIERIEAGVAEAQRQLSCNPVLEAAEKRLDALRGGAATLAATIRREEQDLATLEAQMERDQQRMYSGRIVDPRELSSLERELDHHRVRRDAAEEQLLAHMEEAEETERQIAAASREANEIRGRWETDRVVLQRRIEADTDTLAGLRDERGQVAADIDPPALRLYDQLRHRSGHAVAALSQGVCGTCRVTLPPRDVQHARSGAFVTCPNCARILYAGR